MPRPPLGAEFQRASGAGIDFALRLDEAVTIVSSTVVVAVCGFV